MHSGLLSGLSLVYLLVHTWISYMYDQTVHKPVYLYD